MARIRKSVVTFPEPKQNSSSEAEQIHRSYLEYLFDLADRLLSRPLGDDGSQPA
jgi:hypothetical protein